MARVAIIGSCITRDLWPREGEHDIVYVSRTSLPSLFSPPIPGFRPARAPKGLTRHQHNAVMGDLQKTGLARLVAFEPTHVVFDFIDERFDLLDVDGSLAVETWELVESGYRERLKGARRIPRMSSACDLIWRRGAEEMAAFIRATPLRSACLVLHVSRWATQWRDAAGRLRPIRDVQTLAGRPADVAEHNRLLASYERWFEAAMPPLLRVDAGEFRVAYEGHHWGLSPFHYVPEYYQEVWRQFEAIGIPQRAAPTGSQAWPSAPAA